MAGDGSVVLAGASSGNWSGLNRGGQDFAAVKIDSDGNEIWRWQVRWPVSSLCPIYCFYVSIAKHVHKQPLIVATGFCSRLFVIVFVGRVYTCKNIHTMFLEGAEAKASYPKHP